MIYTIKCLDPNCNTDRIVDTSKWNSSFPSMKVACTKCNKIIREEKNPNYKPDLKTTVIGPNKIFSDEVDNEKAGWIIALSNMNYYPLKIGTNSIGRAESSKTSTIKIHSEDIYFSGAHCIIEVCKENNRVLYFIQDNNSKNGVLLNNQKKLQPQEIYHLQDDDIFILGQSHFRFISIQKIKNEDDLKLIIANMHK